MVVLKKSIFRLKLAKENQTKTRINILLAIIIFSNLSSKKTLFVDDKLENIEGAKKAGLQTWHLNPKTEDVTSLLEFIKNI